MGEHEGLQVSGTDLAGVEVLKVGLHIDASIKDLDDFLQSSEWTSSIGEPIWRNYFKTDGTKLEMGELLAEHTQFSAKFGWLDTENVTDELQVGPTIMKPDVSGIGGGNAAAVDDNDLYS